MHLTRALRIQRGEVVSFVGAGGKTSAMFRLAHELTAEGWRVVTTTTTRLSIPQTQLAPCHLTADRLEPALRALPDLLTLYGQTLVFRHPLPAEGKVAGIPPRWVRHMATLAGVDAILVEADGARERPFKAPASHEPVVPDATTLLIPVVGIDALGTPLDDEHVHRWERAAQLAGLSAGNHLTVEAMAAVMTHPEGGLKGRPPGCRVVSLINKVEGAQQEANARQLARQLLAAPEVDEVVLGAVASAEPASQVIGRTLIVVLAAGGSRRFGRPKLLLPWGDTTLLGNAIQVARASQADRVLVVLGHAEQELRPLIGDPSVQVVVNAAWADGLSTSVRAGLEAAGAGWSAVIFMPADQPGITPAIIDALVERHRHTLAPIIVPVFQGQRGSPVLFDRSLRERLMSLQGDRGGRALFDEFHEQIEHLEVDTAGILQDIDSPADYERLRTGRPSLS